MIEPSTVDPSTVDSRRTNSDGYRLGRSYIAASRLNLQHFMWKDAQKFLLHPTIQADLRRKRESSQTGSKEPIRVADLATGTGLWIFDLAKSADVSGLDIRYHGFDISRALFPHAGWLPKNVVLSTSNLFEDPPEALQGQFDVVHVRLILSLIRSDSPKPIIQHIKKLLKPGGYLQWDELDPFSHYDVLTPASDSNPPSVTATFQRIKELADWSWVAKLPQTLLDEGFEEAIQGAHEPNSEMFKAWTYMDLCSAEELSLHWYGRDDEDGESWRRLIPKAYDEADESTGAILRVRPTVTIARRQLR
ncbi:putative umta methyltransferase family protein [Rosellinia necatrix]|uniref:Putative umta methyltransferase family protein n=1 Tax=Rosellinia necatrix TaxID=77044 RepID=A0A1W2TPE6_ROSNE|nr:putative umta methyltransferase family protein [Rosellinia necatrix]